MCPYLTSMQKLQEVEQRSDDCEPGTVTIVATLDKVTDQNRFAQLEKARLSSTYVEA